ncbi:hypothetical protein GQ457_08G031000 [Hibiscus cannabinus]
MYLLIVFLPLLGSGVAGFFGRFLGSEGRVCGTNLTLLGIILIGLIFLFLKYSFLLNKDSRVKSILHISLLCGTVLYFSFFRSYAIAEFGRFAAEFVTLFMGTCAVTGSSGGADLFGHGNPGNASSELFTYTSDLEEDSASSGRSISTSSVNQPIPREQAGPSNAVPAPQPAAAPAAQQHNHLAAGPNNHEVVGGERMEDIVRRLLLKSDNPSAMDIRLAEIQAEDLFEVKAEIINRMAILHPEGDWENRGARALENSRTLTGEESLERLYRLRDDIVQNGISSEKFRYLKNKVFLRDQNLDAQSQA